MAMLAPTAGHASNPFSTQISDTDWKRISAPPFAIEKNQVKVYFGVSPVDNHSPDLSELRPKTVSGIVPAPLPPVAHSENVSVFWRDTSGDFWCAYAGGFTFLSA
ncbi:MAG: hypothetical protein ACREJQ_00185 [bacterium]